MATVTRETHLKENPYEVARAQLHRVADVFGIDDSLVRVLERCKRGVVVSIPTRMDDGRIEVFTATACSTTSRAARPRAASATTRTSTSTRCARWRCG